MSDRLRVDLDAIRAHIKSIEEIFEAHKEAKEITEELENYLKVNETNITTLGRELLSTLGNRIGERLSTTEDKVARRTNKYLFYCTMLYARKQYLLGYMANVAQEYKVSKPTRFTSAINVDNGQVKEIATFIQNPEKLNQRMVYKYFFLQTKDRCEAFWAMQKVVLEKPEDRMQQTEMCTFKSLKGEYHNLFSFNQGQTIGLGSILKRYLTGPNYLIRTDNYKWYQNPPSRQYWQVFELSSGKDQVSIYNIFDMGYLKVGSGQTAVLETDRNYHPDNHNSFFLKKIRDNQFTITYQKEKAPLITQDFTKEEVGFATTKFESGADLWVKSPVKRKMVKMKSLLNGKYIVRKDSDYCKAAGDQDEAIEFEMLEYIDAKSQIFASFKLPNEEYWLSYTNSRGRLRLYNYPDDEKHMVYWQVINEPNNTKPDYTLFKLKTDNYNQYIGLVEPDSEQDDGQLFVNKHTVAPNEKRCQFKLEIEEVW